MQPHPDSLKAINRLFSYWPHPAVGEAEMRAYVEIATGTNPRLPTNPTDVTEAVSMLVNGRIERKSHEWLPSPGLLASVVKQCRDERLYRENQNKPRIAAPVTVVTEEEMARRREYVRKLRESGVLGTASQSV